MEISNYTKGLVLAVVSAICYGTNPLGAVFLYEEGLNVSSVIFYRFTFATFFLALFIYFSKISFFISKKELFFLAILGFLFAISAFALFNSFLYMDVGLASTILFIYPIFVALIMFFVFKENLSKIVIASIVITFLGVALLYKSDVANVSSFGIFLVFISSISYAIYVVIVNKYLKIHALLVTFYSMFFCSLTIFLLSFTSNSLNLEPLSSFNMWFFTLFLAFVPTIISLWFLIKAVYLIGSTNASILGALEPLTAILIGVMLFDEKLTFTICVGIFLILFGVLLIILQKRVLKLFKVKS